MRYWALLAILTAAGLLETTLAGYFAVGGVSPAPLLAVVLSFGLLFGSTTGLAAGVLGGAMVDVLFGRFIGLETLTLGSVGWLVGQVEERVFKDSTVLPVLAGFLGTFAVQWLNILVLAFFGWRVVPMRALQDVVMPSALFNAIVTAWVYVQIYRRYEYLRPSPRGHIRIPFPGA